MKIVTVVGARPQFIKAAPLSRALKKAGHDELLVHTGQHYDPGMSANFFAELGLPEPRVNLNVGSGPHGEQTGRMLAALEPILVEQAPDAVVLFGDTNSTVAGALAAAKLELPIAHVEAGLRSFNRAMPEEINRVVTDHLAQLLWAPGETAVANLRAEGIVRGVEVVGDIMADALSATVARAAGRRDLVTRFDVQEGRYLLATVHRAENTGPAPLARIIGALSDVGERVLVPLHPRTRAALTAHGITPGANVRLIDPLGHLELIALAQAARLVLTDSGGLQKEAYWLGIPCLTLRAETEWVETVAAGWNQLVGTDRDRIVDAVKRAAAPAARPALYGDGETAPRCVTSLEHALGQR